MSIEKQIQDELNKLDKDLFLDKEWSPVTQSIYYVIKYNIGSGHPPLISKVWGDEKGPWPLSLSIVDAVKAQEGDITEAIAQVKANNAAKKELARQERLAAMEEVAREHQTEMGKIRRFFH